jgi:hypothetical protein
MEPLGRRHWHRKFDGFISNTETAEDFSVIILHALKLSAFAVRSSSV